MLVNKLHCTSQIHSQKRMVASVFKYLICSCVMFGVRAYEIMTRHAKSQRFVPTNEHHDSKYILHMHCQTAVHRLYIFLKHTLSIRPLGSLAI